VKTPLQNITVRLKEYVARWARLRAEMLNGRVPARDSYHRAILQALARKPFLKADGRYLSREEVHFRSFRI